MTPLLLALALTAPARAAEEAQVDEPPVFLSVKQAINRLERYYWQPGWFEPKEMARQAMNRLEVLDDRLVVTWDEHAVTARVGDAYETWSTDGLDDLGNLDTWLHASLRWAVAHLDLEADEDIEHEALSGAVKTLDRFSKLMAGRAAQDFKARTSGSLAGIGSRVGLRRGKIRILKPFPGSPAEKAGLQPGDVITHIDGLSTLNLSTSNAVDRIRGDAGTTVVLTIEPIAGGDAREVAITRARVMVPSIESERLTDRIGLVVIDHFSSRTVDELFTHTMNLLDGGRLEGLVVDLRGNGGGSLNGAAGITNAFVRDGPLVQTVGRDNKPVRRLTERYDADPDKHMFDGPVVVLVDEKTASGSEIVAGILKFRGRALIVGTQTYGKGTVQKVYKLPNKDQMKVTVARYLVADGQWIHDVGVTPDIAVGSYKLDDGDDQAALLGRLPDMLQKRRAEARQREGALPTHDGSNRAPEATLLRVVTCPGWTGASPEAEDASWYEGFGPKAVCDGADDGDDRFGDIPVRFAVELIEALPQGAMGDRADLLAVAPPIIERLNGTAGERLSRALADRGQAWTPEPGTWTTRIPATPYPDDVGPLPDGLVVDLIAPTLVAGEPADLTLKVTNRTGADLHQLRALVGSTHSTLKGLTWLIGDVANGATVRLVQRVSPESSLVVRKDDVSTIVFGRQGLLGAAHDTVSTVRPPAPVLAARTRWRVTDTGYALDVEVRNTGHGPSHAIAAWLRNPEDTRLELGEARVDLAAIRPNKHAATELTLTTVETLDTPVPLSLRLLDEDNAVGLTLPLTLGPGTEAGVWSAWMARPEISEPKAPLEGRSDHALSFAVRDADGLASVAVEQGGDRITWVDGAGETRVRVKLDVELEPGTNGFVVTATDRLGVKTERTVRVWAPRRE